MKEIGNLYWVKTIEGFNFINGNRCFIEDEEIGEYKWSIRRDVLNDDLEIKRLYNFYKEYKNKRSDYLLDDLNKYVISAYHFKNIKS